jgi:L-methionine (R)-S-oxide reductase
MSRSNLPDHIRNVLAQDLDRASKAKFIAEAIRKEGCYRWTSLYDVDIRQGIVSNIAWSGPGAPEYPAFPVTKGLTSRAITGKTTVNVGDVANDSDYLTALATTRSEIIVPVLDIQRDRVIGTLDVESERLNAFDPAAQSLLEEFAVVLRDFLSNRTD